MGWSKERVANELLLKLGIRVSPRAVRKYMPKRSGRHTRDDQHWRTFVQNHASAIVACDFAVVVTATFLLFYVLLVIEHGSRRLLHCNVTEYPTAEWRLRQLREAIPSGHPYRFLIHDRDNIFSYALDQSIAKLGIKIVKTPYRSPQANSICERAIGSMQREFLDYVIPLNGIHLRKLIKDWKRYYNRGRPHSSLGPGVPDPPNGIPAPLRSERHSISDLSRVIATPMLGGLHHDYGLA